MNAPPDRPPLVPVERVVAALEDECDLTDAVARVAAVEAARRGASLEFVHVVDERRSWRDARHDPVLRRGLLALPPHPGPRPELRLLAGWPADALVRLSTPSDLVVLGTGTLHGVVGAVAGSTCVRVLRHASGPVLVVPAALPPEQAAGPVVAAVGLDDDQDTVIAAGFAEAEARGVPLRIVHSCRPGDFAAVFGTGAPVAWADLETHAHLMINRVITREQPGHPSVEVTATVAATSPADLLTRATHHAGLLVVGHRAHAGLVPPPQHLTRSVLRHSRTCVLSVPVGAVRTSLQTATP